MDQADEKKRTHTHRESCDEGRMELEKIRREQEMCGCQKKKGVRR